MPWKNGSRHRHHNIVADIKKDQEFFPDRIDFVNISRLKSWKKLVLIGANCIITQDSPKSNEAQDKMRLVGKCELINLRNEMITLVVLMKIGRLPEFQALRFEMTRNERFQNSVVLCKWFERHELAGKNNFSTNEKMNGCTEIGLEQPRFFEM